MATKFYTAIDLNTNLLKNAVIDNASGVSVPPSSNVLGQIFFDTNYASGGNSAYRRLKINIDGTSGGWVSIPYSGNIKNADIAASAAIEVSKLDRTTATTGVRLDTIGAPTGPVDFNNKNITGLATPVNIADAANKAYVDAAVTGFNVHGPVAVATTAELTGGSYNNGSSGIGATLTFTTGVSSSTVTIDGINNSNTSYILQTNATSPTGVGDRILVRNQTTNPAQNGIYTLTSVSGGTATLTRATDYDGNILGEIKVGDYVLVLNGSSQKGQSYTLTAPSGTIAVGTSQFVFTAFSSASSYSNGTGLNLTGTTFSIDNTKVPTISGGYAVTFTNSGGASSSLIVPAGTNTLAAINQTFYLGTTQVAINAGSSSITSLNGVTVQTATNVASGASGDLLYQSASGTTAKLNIGTNNYILTSSGTIPQWSPPATVRSNINATGKYATEIRNGSTVSSSSASYQIVHNLGTSDVNVQIYDTTGGTTTSAQPAANLVYADVAIGDNVVPGSATSGSRTTTVTVTFSSADTAYYRVVVIG